MNNVIQYLLHSAGTHPDKIAFEDESRSITFGELKKASISVAASIHKILGDTINQPIAIYMEKSVECIVAAMGIVYSGNFYTPIDKNSPQERINKILSTLEPVAIIYDQAEGVLSGDWENLILDETMDDAVDEQWYRKVCDSDPVYVLFTSGSTGTPKGVVISHRGVIDYAEWLASKFCFDEETIFGNQAPFYFDNSVLDIYSTLRNASTMHIIPESYFVFTGKLADYLQNKKINTIFWVPSALITFGNSEAFNKMEFPYLKKILFCGEVMPNKCLNMLRKKMPDVLYANLYGPTEITDVCSYYIVDREFADDDSLPIGFPCENTQIIVLNEENKLVQQDEIGELCVKGSCLSMGYYKNPEKSRDAFVQNPLNDKYAERIYRTGDLVRYNEFGELMYVGRKDYQIKHQGHRIELGEIETATGAVAGVKKSCALYNDVQKKIVLFCEGDKTLVTEKEIYKELKQKVPHYMLPAKINLVEELPLNVNGKIDRVKLKEEI